MVSVGARGIIVAGRRTVPQLLSSRRGTARSGHPRHPSQRYFQKLVLVSEAIYAWLGRIVCALGRIERAEPARVGPVSRVRAPMRVRSDRRPIVHFGRLPVTMPR